MGEYLRELALGTCWLCDDAVQGELEEGGPDRSDTELEPYFITDSLEIREIIAALMALDNNWRNYWASTPMHTFMFVFYEMDQKVAIVHVGENWIFMDGLIRTCTEAELEALTGRFPKRNYDYNLLETDCGG